MILQFPVERQLKVNYWLPLSQERVSEFKRRDTNKVLLGQTLQIKE